LNKKGISPIIASVLSIMFGIIMLVIVLTVIQPTFKRASDSSTITDIFQNLQLLNSGIKEVSSEARGSKRTIPLTVSGGEYRINSTYDWLYVVFEPESDFKVVGRRGDIRAEYGLEFMDYFNWYVDGSDGSPIWKNTSGVWSVSDLKYVGANGTAYMNITPRPIENFEFGGIITNISGTTGGQVFVLPTNPEKLIGFWTFDEGSGNQAYDWSGNKNNGTLNGFSDNAVNWTSSGCAFGKCLVFDGGNDYVSGPLTTSSTITISIWIKPSVLESTDENFIIRGSPNSWEFVYDPTASPYHWRIMVYGSVESATLDVNDNVNVNELAHYVFVLRYGGGNNNLTVYKNGWLVGSHFNSTDIGPANTPTGFRIGQFSGLPYNGRMDEIMIFNSLLAPDEVKALYETSTKKLGSSGSRTIDSRIKGGIVLSNPFGQAQFDDIKVVRDKNTLTFIIPYSKIDINGTLRLRAGEHQIQIEHVGTNDTLNKPIIEIKSGAD